MPATWAEIKSPQYDAVHLSCLFVGARGSDGQSGELLVGQRVRATPYGVALEA